MDNITLRKAQLIMLDILKEVDRVCKENEIKYFLIGGSCLGAIRHGGFIPWDDDLDVGMLREDYEKFCSIAPQKINSNYFLQTWMDGTKYGLPFAKIRRKGTMFFEAKAPIKGRKEIYVDIMPCDAVPEENRDGFFKKQDMIYRIVLMKNEHRPWKDGNKILWKKYLAYIPYRIASWFVNVEKLQNCYEQNAKNVVGETKVYFNEGYKKNTFHDRKWFEECIMVPFEGERFPVIKEYDQYLSSSYGDYMTPPPERERGNMHQALSVDLGED